MSNLIFNFESEDPDANIGNLTYTLSGITIKGTFNTSTGEIFPEEATGEVSTQPTLNTTSSNPSNKRKYRTRNSSWQCILYNYN